VTTDTELEIWRQEWRNQTEPLPELRKKIRRQNLRTVAAVVAICLCLAFSTVEALRNHSSFMAGLAAGISFASLFLGGYAWWVRRGAWKPTAQTTLAYAELSYKRALAKTRTLHFAFYFLLAATVLFAAFMAWNWKTFRARDGALIAAMVLEMFFLKHYRRRKKAETEETKKLIDDIKE
jgi:thiosulfate reductase cytochrome b subunit